VLNIAQSNAAEHTNISRQNVFISLHFTTDLLSELVRT